MQPLASFVRDSYQGAKPVQQLLGGLLCGSSRPNARFQPLLEAEATQERTLFAVTCMPLFGPMLQPLFFKAGLKRISRSRYAGTTAAIPIFELATGTLAVSRNTMGRPS
jgi:hypothetical protein